MVIPPLAKIKGLARSTLGPSTREMATILLFLLMYRHDPGPLDTLIGWLRQDGLNVSGVEEKAIGLSEALRERVATLEREAENA